MSKAKLLAGLAAFSLIVSAHAQIVNPGTPTSGNPANNDCAKFVVVGGNVQSITSAGAACAGSPAAATSLNDTNVTLTLNGTPATALLQNVQWQLGWTGTLAASRLNSNVVQGVTDDTNITGSISAQNLTLGWTGTLAASRLNSNVVQGVVNDTNVTGSIAAQSLTFGWSGVLAVTRGGIGVGSLGSDLSNVTNLHIGAFTGDVSKAAGSLATTVTAWQGLAVRSGVPSNGQVYAWNATNSDFELSSAGTGTVTTSGSPSNFQTASFTGANVISGIGPGTLGQALVSNGASNYPSYQSGPWTLLATLTASSSATLSDITHFTSNYNDYLLVFTNVIPATNGVNAELQVHSGGSFQATTYITNAIIGASSQSPTTFIPLALQASDVPNTAPGISGSLLLTGFNVASTPKNWIGQVGYVTGSSYRTLSTGGIWNSTSAIDGFQFLFSTGNISSGSIKIYGHL